VRCAPFLAIIALGVAAIAKEPKPTPAPSRSRQVQGLDAPDLKREFNLEQMTPFGRSKSEFQVRDARTNSFYFQQKFTPKGYEAGSFRTKTAWDSDFKFATKDARTKSFETKAAPVKAAPVKEAPDAGKSAATREFYDANRTTAFKGRNQALFDKEGPAGQAKIGPGWSGDLKTLTVDDIREILNKNK
jgi:hypothetical protein